jgi:hypothetical protein
VHALEPITRRLLGQKAIRRYPIRKVTTPVAIDGRVAGERPPAVRYADPDIFEHAPRYHGGGFAGSGLLPDEVPIIARRGELVVPPERVVREEKSAREQRPIWSPRSTTSATGRGTWSRC